MILATLFSKGPQRDFIKSLSRRNRSVMLYFGIVLFITFPLQYILEVFNPWYVVNHHDVIRDLGNHEFDLLSHHTGPSLFFVFAVVLVMTLYAGLSQFSYMHTKRSVDVFHSLPIKRSTLIFGGVLSAAESVIIPLAANYLVVIVAGLVRMATLPQYEFMVPYVLMDFALWAIVIFSTLCIVAFVAVQVGTIFDNFIFSCELLIVLPILIWFTIMICDSTLRGFVVSEDVFSYGAFASPITLMAERYMNSGYEFSHINFMPSTIFVLVWLVLSVGILFAADYIYRRRRSEVAETSTANAPLAQFGVLAVVYVVGMTGGMLMGDMLMSFAAMNSGGTLNRISFVVWSFVFAALAFILTQAILQRGFKGLRSSLLRGGVAVGITTVASVIFITGGLGYESRIPAAEDVESITINYRGSYVNIGLLNADEYQVWFDDFGNEMRHYMGKYDLELSQSETVNLVRDIHAIAADPNAQEAYYELGQNLPHAGWFEVTYNLSNGMKISRRYGSTETSPAFNEILKLEASSEFTEKTHPAFVTTAEDYASMTITNTYGLDPAVVSSEQDIERLLQAFRLDLLADDETALIQGDQTAIAYIEFESSFDPSNAILTEDTYVGGYITIYPHYKNTIMAFEQMGISQYSQVPDEMPDEIFIMPDGYGMWYNGDSVIHELNNANKYYSSEEINMLRSDMSVDGIVVNDPATIASLLSAGYNRSVNGGEPLTMIVVDDDGQSVGATLFINYNDLPKSLSSQLPEWVQHNYAETVPMPAGNINTTHEMNMQSKLEQDEEDMLDPLVAVSINAGGVYGIEWSFDEQGGGMTAADNSMLPLGEVVMFGEGLTGVQTYTVTILGRDLTELSQVTFTHDFSGEQIELTVTSELEIVRIQKL